MTRLTMLFIAAALVLPGAAVATPAPDRDAGTRAAFTNGVDLAAQDAKARAVEAYYSSYGKPEPLAAPATEPVSTGSDGLPLFAALGIGFGVVLLAGGIGVYAGRSMRPRGVGA
jgi:hypothetical protein